VRWAGAAVHCGKSALGPAVAGARALTGADGCCRMSQSGDSHGVLAVGAQASLSLPARREAVPWEALDAVNTWGPWPHALYEWKGDNQRPSRARAYGKVEIMVKACSPGRLSDSTAARHGCPPAGSGSQRKRCIKP
jgi:hypothetical protein